MQAKFQGQCYLCSSEIRVGDEITRSNAERSHRSYVHTRCNPAAGIYNRARFQVVVTASDPQGYIAVGEGRRFVHRSVAEGNAKGLRQLGATVEVRELV